jgi:hypothetical protein
MLQSRLAPAPSPLHQLKKNNGSNNSKRKKAKKNKKKKRERKEKKKPSHLMTMRLVDWYAD